MKFVFMPWEVAATPREGYVHVDRHWQCIPGKDGGIIFADFGRGHYSPQCNRNPQIVEQMAAENGFLTQYLNTVYVGHRDEEGNYRGLSELVKDVESGTHSPQTP